VKRKIVLLAIVIALAAGVVGAFLVPITVGGKEGPAKPGAPAYTEALKSSALPPVPPKFGGEIKPVEKESTTWWFGKNHNTPAFQASQAGPFDQWPIGMGFQYFYGFVGGDTSQWQPNLFRGTDPIYPYVGNPKWNLTTAMADDAIAHIKRLNETAPDKPFLVHYTPGGTHAPHHPTPEWIEKFKGKFSMGWNQLREQIFANQKKLGVIPADAVLTPWPDELKKWDALTADEKKMFERQVEVYAAYLAYTDYEIGRVIQACRTRVSSITRSSSTSAVTTARVPRARRSARRTRWRSSTASRFRWPTS